MEEDSECPEIAVFPRDPDDQLFGDRTTRNDAAIYRSLNNSIYLGLEVCDDNVDVVLIHELAHWATIQALPIGTRWDIIEERLEWSPIFERIAYQTELFYILDQVKHHCSVEEAYRFAAQNNHERRQLLNIDVRLWWLVSYLRLCKGMLEGI